MYTMRVFLFSLLFCFVSSAPTAKNKNFQRQQIDDLLDTYIAISRNDFLDLSSAEKRKLDKAASIALDTKRSMADRRAALQGQVDPDGVLEALNKVDELPAYSRTKQFVNKIMYLALGGDVDFWAQSSAKIHQEFGKILDGMSDRELSTVYDFMQGVIQGLHYFYLGAGQQWPPRDPMDGAK